MYVYASAKEKHTMATYENLIGALPWSMCVWDQSPNVRRGRHGTVASAGHTTQTRPTATLYYIYIYIYVVSALPSDVLYSTGLD